MTKKMLLFVFLLISKISYSQHRENVEFYNGKKKLAAVLYIPEQPGKHPAIAVTHGSGKDSKDDAGFISFATMLCKEGFEVLLYDKSGVGSSGGEYIEVPDISVPAGDLVEAVKYLESRQEVDKTRTGVYGHSQGGWVAPMAAVISGNIDFVMVACGGGVSIREQDLYSYRAGFKHQGYSPATIDSIISFTRQLFTYLATGIGYTGTNASYVSAVNEPWFTFFKKMGFTDRLPGPSMLNMPVFNFFKAISYDPQATLRALDVPVFVLLGGKDETVPSEKSKQLWEDAFIAGNHPGRLTVTILPEEDHYDFERTGNAVTYKKTFFAPVISWLEENINRQR